MSNRVLYIRLFVIVLLSICLTDLSIADDWSPGIQELYRIDRLPEFKESIKVESISSYDRTGGNNDGFGGQYSFVRKEKDGLVIADLKGPGVIYRIWTPTPTDDMLEFYFDGESKPSILVKFRDLFLGKHPVFVRPLVGYGAGGFYSYVPLPYKKSCKVFIRAERLQFYQINYATYPKRMELVSFPKQPQGEYKNHLKKAIRLFESTGTNISSYAVPPGGQIERFNIKTQLKSGETVKIFEIDRPGRIIGIRISPSEALADKQRRITLRAYWDDDKEPAILCPAGDFFGYAWGEPAIKSLLVGTANGANYCYFPMPFDKSATIELLTDKSKDKEVMIEAEVLFVPIARRENEGRFYALWKRENPTTKGKPFTFIETKGKGHLVGFIQQSQGFESGNTYYFEGDDQTTIDDELVIHGTGSEDFYNGGWYDVTGRWDARRSFPLSGCIGYKKHLGRTGGYRFLLGDKYSYRKSVLQTIEHSPTKNELLNDYCGVTFLYSKNRPTCEFALPAIKDRKVIDLKRIVFATWWNIPISAFSYQNASLAKINEKVDDKNVRFLSLRAKGNDMFGNHFVCFVCELPATGEYKISIDTVKGPSQGKVQIFVDEAPAGPVLDLYAAKRETAMDKYIGTLKLAEGQNYLLFKLVGKNEQSQGLNFDIRNIICERIDTDNEYFKQAEDSSKIAGYSISKVKRWLHEVAIKKIDPATGLYIGDGRWNYRDTAADCYPFLCWAAFVTDIDMLNGPIRDVLDAERKLCNHLDRIPARYDLKNNRKDDSVSYDTLIFGASEYVKDGLIAIVEVTGKADWFQRMKEIEDDVWKHARIETKYGKIPSTNIEVNGEQLQALTRLYTMTGEKKYLEWARRLGDYYLSNDDFLPERLRDHGCEIIGGLGLLLAVETELESDRAKIYQRRLKHTFDTILKKGCNEDGMMYNYITTHERWNDRLSDGWGYNYIGYICYDMISGAPVYRQHIEQTLRNLSKPKYKNYPWEGTSIDGFADSVEGGIYVLNRYPVKEGFDWVNSEVANNIAYSNKPLETAELWGTMKLQANGVRTTIMHALMHTQGLIARPWDIGMELGACPTANGLAVVIKTKKDYKGKIFFDISRHKHYMGFKQDWPRMNTLPQWFTVEPDNAHLYKVENFDTGKTKTVSGKSLSEGLSVHIKPGKPLRLKITRQGNQ